MSSWSPPAPPPARTFRPSTRSSARRSSPACASASPSPQNPPRLLSMRLQAFLARAGAAPSRRKAEALITAGRVSVNGETATLGITVSPEDDAVLLDGERITLPQSLAYLALNKPAGYLTTLKDEPGRNRPTIKS